VSDSWTADAGEGTECSLNVHLFSLVCAEDSTLLMLDKAGYEELQHLLMLNLPTALRDPASKQAFIQAVSIILILIIIMIIINMLMPVQRKPV
jgi:hypothetical protein